MELSELLAQSKAPPARGRKPKPVVAAVERELEEADVKALWDLPNGGLQTPTQQLVRIRHRHHMLARLLAGGSTESEAALVTGYNLASISVLKQDPAFKELLSYYHAQKEEIFIDFFERLKMLSIHTADELLDRLDANPELFTVDDLQKILTLAADRTGFGPTKSVDFRGAIGVISAERLAKIKQEVTSRQNGNVERLDKKNPGLTLGSPVDKSLVEEAEIIEGTTPGD